MTNVDTRLVLLSGAEVNNNKCCVIIVITSVADPAHFFPDPSDPKKTGSYLDMFFMFSKINILYGIFLPI